MAAEKLRIHFLYVTSILLGCLIGMTAYKFSPSKPVVDLVAFAVGISSLVLAMIAIVQNIVSGPALQASVDSLKEVAAQVVGVTATMNDAGRSLSSKLSVVDALPSQISGMKEDILERLSSSQRDNDLLGSVSRENASHGGESFTFIPKTFGGEIASYIVAKAVKSGNRVSLADIFPDEPTTRLYSSAYVAALRDSGTIKAKYDGLVISSATATKWFESETILSVVLDHHNDWVQEQRRLIDAYFSGLH